MRNTGILPVAVLSGLCLAASLGCGGKAHYSVPDVANYNPAQGPVGTTVVISGADFSGVSVISFGGQPSQAYKVNSQSLITATVPPTAATGPVTVENPAGIGTSYSSFIVTPTVTAISPASGPSNTAVTVAGTGLNTTSSVTIGGQSCTFTIHSATEVVVVVSPAAVTGSVVFTASALTATGPVFTVQ
jgi:hypothetical protein